MLRSYGTVNGAYTAIANAALQMVRGGHSLRVIAHFYNFGTEVDSKQEKMKDHQWSLWSVERLNEYFKHPTIHLQDITVDLSHSLAFGLEYDPGLGGIKAKELEEKSPSAPSIFKGLTLKLDLGGIYFITGPAGLGKTSLARILAQVDVPSHGLVHSPPMLRYAYVDSSAHVLPGGSRPNLYYGAELDTDPADLVQRVASRVGVDPTEAEPVSESDRLKLTVARAIITDPDILVVNAENMPRGLWLRGCLEALYAWQAGEFDGDTQTALLWDVLGTGRVRIATSVMGGHKGWVGRQVSAFQILDGPFSAVSTPIVVTKSSLKDSTASKAAIHFKMLEEI